MVTLQSSIKQRVYEDIEKRSQNGAYIYTAAWLAIGLGTGFYEQQVAYFYSFLAVFVCLGAIRLGLYFKIQHLDKTKHAVWPVLLYFNALAPAMLMSTLFTLSMLSAIFEPMYFYLLLTIFAMLSGGVVNFSPHPMLSLTYLIALIFPAFAGALVFSDKHYIESTMLVLYGIFMFGLSRRLSKEYEQLVSQQEELEKLNNQDSLTGIANRRSFDNRFNIKWDCLNRSASPLSLIIIDIDHFKKVNDNLGHAAGDEVIREVARMIKIKIKRKSDCVARIGGEEFGAIVPLTDYQQVVTMADDCRQLIQQTPIIWEGEEINLTVSVGVASCIPSAQIKPLALFKAADKCLYEAKTKGRNLTISENLIEPTES